jgi:outer membrane receptor for ferrienterochelin and colicins
MIINRRAKHLFLCSWLFAIFSLYAGAPDSLSGKNGADSLVNLDKVVVTASRTKRLMSETPASVSVISKDMISASPAKTIEDLLLTQTGVQVKRVVSIGEGIPSDIIFRGIPGSLAATRTLILVDGIPTNASGTPFLIVNEIPLDAVERIEIVRGPYSGLYGANAFGGVVNVITKEGYGKPTGSVSLETSYPFSVLDQYFSQRRSMATSLDTSGTLAYWNANGTVSGGTDKYGILVSGGYRAIGNYLLRDSGEVRNGTIVKNKSSANSDYKEARLFAKARFFCTDNTEVSLHMRYFNSDLGFGKTKNIVPDSMDVDTKGQKFLIGPQIKISFSKDIVFHAGAFYRHVDGEFWNEDQDSSQTWVRSYRKFAMDDWQAESRGTFSLGSSNTFVAGLEVLRNGADFGPESNPANGELLPGSDATKKAIVNSAGYVQDEINLFDRLNIVPVARVDYQSEFGAALSPKLGVSYKIIDQVRFRASAGRSFRAPSLAELGLDIKIDPTLHLIPNPDLKPEYIWGFDAGFDITPIKSLVLKIGPYYNSMQNLIGEALELNIGSVTYRNISAAWSEGVEGEIGWSALPWLFLSTHGTIQKSQDEYYHTSLDYVPRYTFGSLVNAAHEFNAMKIEGNIGFNYVGSRSFLDFSNAQALITPTGQSKLLLNPPVQLGSYNTLDVSCKISRNAYFLTLSAQNIFNTKYEESEGALAPGRFATIKIGYNF